MKKDKLVLGTWAWGDNNSYFGNNYDESHFGIVYQAARNNGLNFWDTAYAYGAGDSEQILGDLIKNTPREQLTISTKFTPQMADNSADPVANMLDGSLKRLNTNYVDYYWIHNNADIEKWTPMIAPLVKSGKVKHIGVSNHNLSEIKRVQKILAQDGVKLDAVQNHFSLLDRTSEQAGILEYCQENDIEFFAYMVLEQGALSGKYTVDNPFPAGSVRAQVYNHQLPELTSLVDELNKVGEKYNLSAAQIAIAWAIAKDTLPIIGATKAKHVEEAAKAAQVQLSPEEVNHLEEVAAHINADTIGSWEQDMRE